MVAARRPPQFTSFRLSVRDGEGATGSLPLVVIANLSLRPSPGLGPRYEAGTGPKAHLAQRRAGYAAIWAIPRQIDLSPTISGSLSFGSGPPTPSHAPVTVALAAQADVGVPEGASGRGSAILTRKNKGRVAAGRGRALCLGGLAGTRSRVPPNGEISSFGPVSPFWSCWRAAKSFPRPTVGARIP